MNTERRQRILLAALETLQALTASEELETAVINLLAERWQTWR